MYKSYAIELEKKNTFYRTTEVDRPMTRCKRRGLFDLKSLTRRFLIRFFNSCGNFIKFLSNRKIFSWRVVKPRIRGCVNRRRAACAKLKLGSNANQRKTTAVAESRAGESSDSYLQTADSEAKLKEVLFKIAVDLKKFSDYKELLVGIEKI
jgi:hypothetical protein